MQEEQKQKSNTPWEEKIAKAKQLLLLHHKLHELQESCWGRFFRFEQSELFKSVEKKLSFRGVIRIRLDDIIYMILLMIICIVFFMLPESRSGNSLTTAYRQFLVELWVFSGVWLVSGSGYRHCVNVGICIVFPTLVILAFKNVLKIDQIDTSTSLFEYGRFLTLWIVFACLYMTYPLKQFIRNKIGSLYSYLFALSFLTLFFIWPAYSLLEEYLQNQKLTFNFITKNKALIIAFLVIIVFSFHLFIHHTFFEGKLQRVKVWLYAIFNKGQLTRALEEVDVEGEMAQSFLYRNYEIYTRVMSALVFIFTVGVEIFVFVYLSNNLSQMLNCIGVMVFALAFLVYGCIINLLKWPRPVTLMLFTLLSLIPCAFSPFFYSLSFYQYIFLTTALPYATIFWLTIRSLSPLKPFLRLNILVTLYILLHIPVTLFVINSLGMISGDPDKIKIVNYVIIGVCAAVGVAGIVGFIVWICHSVRSLPDNKDQKLVPVQYNYYDSSNPAYEPYKKTQSFSLAWLGSLDIRNLAELFTCICFICCELATMYVFNELNNTLKSKQLATESSRDLIKVQFYGIFLYYLFSFFYISISKIAISTAIFVGLFLVFGACTAIALSYAYAKKFALYFVVRVGGGFTLVVFALALALFIIKRRNKEIINFLGGLLIILIWIFLVIPYVMAIPIGAIYLPSDNFGQYVYLIILGSTLLLILIVSSMSLIFNILMNKFEEEKKIKFITEDVKVYLEDEGIEVQDEALHIFYESFEFRDEKFVYFMKRGYPIRLFKEKSQDGEENTSAIVYHHEDILRRASMTHISDKEEEQNSCCWACLTCLCGNDDDDIHGKARAVAKGNDQQMQKLVPQDFFRNVFVSATKLNKKKQEQKNVNDPSKIHSSKSIILKRLHRQARQLGPKYSKLKMKKTKKLAIQLWHDVFDFFANDDDGGVKKIIYNDFEIFCEIMNLKDFQGTKIRQIYFNFARTSWKNITSFNLADFALAMEDMAGSVYPSQNHNEDKQTNFLIDHVYPKLSQYSQFQDSIAERETQTRIRKEKKSETNNSLIHYDTSFDKFALAGEQQQEQLSSSPFITSFPDYLEFQEQNRQQRERLRSKKNLYERNKLVEPMDEENPDEKKGSEKFITEEKGKSCKRLIFEKYLACKECCGEKKKEKDVKRKKTKPWDYLSVEAIRIMEHKDAEWRSKKEEKEYEFRCIVNNILIAVLKLADIYTYLEITLMNPTIGWQSFRSFTYLIIEYRIQLYIALALVVISFTLGIKGIGYIFEDRLGLTETRIPASFPHPMFFFTFIYKLLILSLFNTIIITLFSTFVCDWHTHGNNFSLLINGGKDLECFSFEHNIYLMCSIIGILMYYPMSAYTMPNFQFAEKRLDLKFKPSYLIIYFQVNFVISAGKVLLSLVNTTRSFQIFFQTVNISALFILCLSVLLIKPCLISWFNFVQLLVGWIGLIWNVMGLVLFLTKQRVLCIIIAGALTAASLIFFIVFIRKRYFGFGGRVQVMDGNEDQILQLEMGWKYRKHYNVEMVRMRKEGEPISEKDEQGQGKAERGESGDGDSSRFNLQSRQLKTRSGSNKNIVPQLEFVRDVTSNSSDD